MQRFLRQIKTSVIFSKYESENAHSFAAYTGKTVGTKQEILSDSVAREARTG